MADFAQTGAQQDDLFDDIQYGEESMQTRAADDLFGDDFTPAEEPVVETPVSDAPVAQRASRGGRGRGDGRGGRGGPRGGRGEVRGGRGGRGRGRGEYQQLQSQRPREVVPDVDAVPTTTAPKREGQQETAEVAPTEESTALSPPVATQPGPGPLADSRYSDAPTKAIEQSAKPNNTARGDRRATGGLQKPKLTPAELEAKMQRMSLRSAELTERHQRAEADRQSFDKREEVAKEVAKQRTKEERRDRQQMMGEREKNRQRKLKAMEGREWDMQKQEGDYDPRAAAQRGGSGRGAHGGVVGARDATAAAPGFGRDQEDYTDGREYMYREDRGRGGRGGRGGARGGRGGSEQQKAPKHSDFPELPAAGTATSADAASGSPAPAVMWPKKDSAEPAPAVIPELPKPDVSVAAGGKSWADMIDG